MNKLKKVIVSIFKLTHLPSRLRLEGKKMSKLGGKKETATVVTLPKVTSVKAALDDHSNTESVSFPRKQRFLV